VRSPLEPVGSRVGCGRAADCRAASARSIGGSRQKAQGLLAPHGLEEAHINLMTNEHTVLKFRTSKDGPLQHSRTIRLGTLDHDVTVKLPQGKSEDVTFILEPK